MKSPCLSANESRCCRHFSTQLLDFDWEVDLLARLFGEVLIPDIVARELADSEAPLAVVKWASQFPSWISVRPTPLAPEPLEKLDAGE